MKWEREEVKRKTSNNWSAVLQIALKGGEGGWEFCLEKFWPFNAFVMLQVRFSNHQLTKISMIYLYIKPKVKKKNNTTAMTTAINEGCIGRLHENCYLVRRIFMMWKTGIFLLPGIILPPKDFHRMVGLGEGIAHSIHGVGNKQHESRGNIFGKMWSGR